MDSQLNVDGTERRVAVVKGEMPGWSDLAVGGGSGGPVFEHLLRHNLHDRSHTLVVGPHDWRVVDLVVGRSKRTTLLLRGHSDALEAADRYSDDNVAVVCGDVLSVSLDEPADALVALDGLDRTVSVECASPRWQETLSHLIGFLTDDATTLLTVDNPLGISRLAQVPSAEADDRDDAWCTAAGADATRPRTLDRASVVLGDAVAYSLHPTVTTPTLATGIGVVPAGSGLEALVVAHNTLAPARLDTRTTMRRVADAGRIDEFAAGWMLVSHGAASTPFVAVAGDRSTGVTETFTPDGESFLRRVEAAEDITREGWTVVPGEESRLPSGRLLEEALLEACAMRDIGTVRRLLTMTAERLRGATSDELGRLAGATFESLVMGPDGELTPLSHYLRRTDVPTPDALLLELFDDFAGRVLALGWKHPWPVADGRDEISLLMAATVGIQSTRDDVAEARSARESVDHSLGSPVGRLVAAQPETIQRLTRENEALASKVRWFETALRQREKLLAELRRNRGQEQRPRVAKKLREAEAELAEIKGSRSFRLARALTHSARAAGRLRRMKGRT